MEIDGDTILTEFVNDWFYGEGFPIYSAEYAPVEDGILKITLSQTSSHPSVDFFEMPVPVRIYNVERTDSTDFRLINTSNNQEFLVNVGFKVTELKIDPDYWLVSKKSQIVSVPADPKLNEISIYPNPFTEIVSIVLPTGQQMVSGQLFSSNGQFIKQIAENETMFNWSNIPKGVYIIHVKTKLAVFEQKIVKQ
jgi:hypothetical protein